MSFPKRICICSLLTPRKILEKRTTAIATSPPATPRFDTLRFDTVDILRGLAILAVILLHIWIRFQLSGFHLKHGLPRWATHFFENGGNGVTVFFAVSGFLITWTSIRRFQSLAAIQPRPFYRIRFARIGPPLLLLLAVFSVLHLLHVEDFTIHKPHASLPGALFSALTFTLNWYEAAHMHSYLPACWTVLWSLSIEEMFYLFFPLLCVVLLRFRQGKAVFITLLLAIVASGCFARTIWTRGDDLAQENSYFAGFSDIAVGVLAALLAHHLATRKRPLAPSLLIALQAIGATLILLFATWPRWPWIKPFFHFTAISATDDTLLSIGAALVILGSVLRARPGRFWTAPIRWCGRHSYELYLTHEFVVLAGVNHFLKVQTTRPPGPMLAWTAAILLLCMPVAWLVARFFSEPLNRRLRGAPRAFTRGLSEERHQPVQNFVNDLHRQALH